MKAIVYTSKTGSTEQYAKMLAEKLQIPYYPLKTARRQLPMKSEILYLGWVMGGKVNGYKVASKCYRVLGVCAVGMAQNNPEALRNQNLIPQKTPLFSLQGNFDLSRLTGIHRLIVKIFIKVVENKVKTQGVGSELLEMMINGKQGVEQNNLEPVLEFYNKKSADAVNV